MLNDRKPGAVQSLAGGETWFERVVVSPVTLTSHSLEVSTNCPLLLEDLAVEN